MPIFHSSGMIFSPQIFLKRLCRMVTCFNIIFDGFCWYHIRSCHFSDLCLCWYVTVDREVSIGWLYVRSVLAGCMSGGLSGFPVLCFLSSFGQIVNMITFIFPDAFLNYMYFVRGSEVLPSFCFCCSCLAVVKYHFLFLPHIQFLQSVCIYSLY